MKPGIYVETKPIRVGESKTPFGHAYLVYRHADGTEEVIRGGPDDGAASALSGKIRTEAGVPLAESKDAYRAGDTPQTRRAKRIDLGDQDAEIVWRQMKAAAKQVGERGIDYDAVPWQNSNSTIRHVLEAAAIDPAKAMGPGWNPRDFPGYNNDLNEPNSDFDRERTGTAGRKRRRDGGSPDFRGLGLVDKVLAALDPREPNPDHAAKRIDDDAREGRAPLFTPPHPVSLACVSRCRQHIGLMNQKNPA